MRRFETLNPETKDLVLCLLPALATSFGVSDPVDIIPRDIRMRAWDCERRDHIKEETEDDPRNWGVQFIKDLMAISRLKKGDLATFQADLYAKCALHEPKHPWCRLNDIRELKDEYEHPERKNQVEVVEPSSSSSTDSYFEELVEPDEVKGAKRRRGGAHEVYEARVMKKRHKHKPARLRRADTGGFERHDPAAKKRQRASNTPNNGRHIANHGNRPVLTDEDDDEDVSSVRSSRARSLLTHPAPAFSLSPGPRAGSTCEVDVSNESLAVQKLQAELDVAEAELKAARLKYQYIQAKEQAEARQMQGNGGALGDAL
ncbi:hypothetical protein J3E72DRAFT_272461 [Bipolaris maydis]|nr:hypothetical protein BM1_03573 [Bipolaris maydis]KAJ5022499.1 hypothetical protein J3E73DRAFT_393654 [Bipolaris maydis]KAJ6193202.1 hypothetical protein J3E72DRAFT_272461 [Bipolaris maydis]KAJ6277037.1 hypothetical protein J3E71DRAFT_186053 [Bipolaris maydis]